MKNSPFIFLTLLWCLITSTTFSQNVTTTTNVKEGKWSDTSIWSNNRLPNENDQISLSYNIEIDTTAFCQSLTTNSYSVIVLSGNRLTITGSSILKNKNIIRLSTTTRGSDYVLRKWEWKYDNLNRCTELLESMRFNFNDTFRVFARSTFFYFGASNSPFRVFQDQYEANIKSDVYFKFNSEGKKIQDSIIYTHPANGQLLKIFDYKHEGSFVFGHFRMANISWKDPSTDFTFNTHDTMYLSGGNTVVVRKQFRSFSRQVEKYSFTYDNRINPLTQQNIAAFYQLGPDLNYNRWLLLEATNKNLAIIGFNKNNITSFYETNSPQTVVSYSYIYDNDNYPIESIISFSYTSEISKVTYEYKD